MNNPTSTPIFSVLEEHIDGSIWYHPGWSCKSEEEAKALMKHKHGQDLWKDRTMVCFTHTKPFHQDRAVWTIDLYNFHDRSGAVVWNKDKGILD